MSKEELPYLEGMITVSRAAEILGVTKQAVHQMAQNGRLKAWRVESASQDEPVVLLEEEVRKARTGTPAVVDVLRQGAGASRQATAVRERTSPG